MTDKQQDPWGQFPDAPQPAQQSRDEHDPWGQFPDAKAPAPHTGAAAFARPVSKDALAAIPDKDERTWGEWALDLVRGRQDPRYAGIKSFDEEMQAEQEGGVLNQPAIRKLRLGALTAGDDAAYGDIMQSTLGDRFIRREKDKHGYEIIVYRAPDGTEKAAYVNKPGLDAEDISRGLVSGVPYMIGGMGTAVAAKGLPILARAGAQALAGAGTSALLDVGAGQIGSQQGVDPERAAVIGLTGGAGELAAPAVAALWRKLVTVPGLYDAAAGQLTPKGMQVAAQIGLDPRALTADMAEKLAKTYAMSHDAAAAGRQFAADTLGIESTVGQRTKNPVHLLEEGSMWRGLKGDAAQREMQAFYDRQRAQLRNAALGNPEAGGAGNLPNSQGIAASLNPTRSLDDLSAADLGDAIQQGLRSARSTARAAESDAWQGLHTITAHPDAMNLLPQAIGQAVGEREVDQFVTPAAYRMAEMLQRYMTGEAAAQPFSVLGQSASRPTVDGMRRRLLGMMRGAQTGEDRAVAGRLYDGFNDWIGQAADAQLLAGHPDAAAALRGAREISRDIKDLFQPRDTTGRLAPAKRILETVMDKADSPEAVVRTLIGNPSSDLKVGVPDALGRIKTALEQYGGTAGRNVWNDIRSAYWMKMVTNAKGELLSPQMMLNTIKAAQEKQATVINRLFDVAERNEIAKLVKALEQITYKDPNPSGSGYAIAKFAKDFLGHIMEHIPGAQKLVLPLKIAYNMTGAQNIAGRAAARAATQQQPPRATLPILGPEAAALAQQYMRGRSQNN